MPLEELSQMQRSAADGALAENNRGIFCKVEQLAVPAAGAPAGRGGWQCIIAGSVCGPSGQLQSARTCLQAPVAAWLTPSLTTLLPLQS